MSGDEPGRNLPVLKERTISESEYRQLRAGRDEAEQLRSAIAALRRGSEESRRPLHEFLLLLLPVADGLDRALVAARASQDYDAVVAGVDLVRRELSRVLGLENVERVPVAVGDPFDLDFHCTLEGLDMTIEPGVTIVEELRAGYRRGERVLRPAIVRVEP